MNQKETKSPTRKNRGAILLLTTILLFVILGMVVSLSYVTVMEQKMSSKTKSSVASFYNSESGVEWTLNKIASATDSTILSAFGGASRFNTDYSVKCPDAFGTETCKVYLLDQDGKVITNTSLTPSDIKAVRSVGSQGGDTQRAIEAAVAATDFPKGAIVLWSGQVTNPSAPNYIPTGWKLCDGTNGTPDYRGKFVAGAPAGADPDTTYQGRMGSGSGYTLEEVPFYAVAFIMKD